MMILSDNEVTQIAWHELLNGAASWVEDWIDEDGEFTEEDAERVFDEQRRILDLLRIVPLENLRG